MLLQYTLPQHRAKVTYKPSVSVAQANLTVVFSPVCVWTTSVCLESKDEN